MVDFAPGGVTPRGLVSSVVNRFEAWRHLVSIVEGSTGLPEGKPTYTALKNKLGVRTYPESVGADAG
jgi:hypothetical protein